MASSNAYSAFINHIQKRISIWSLGKLWCIFFTFYSIYANRLELVALALAGLSLVYYFEHVDEEEKRAKTRVLEASTP